MNAKDGNIPAPFGEEELPQLDPLSPAEFPLSVNPSTGEHSFISEGDLPELDPTEEFEDTLNSFATQRQRRPIRAQRNRIRWILKLCLGVGIVGLSAFCAKNLLNHSSLLPRLEEKNFSSKQLLQKLNYLTIPSSNPSKPVSLSLLDYLKTIFTFLHIPPEKKFDDLFLDECLSNLSKKIPALKKPHEEMLSFWSIHQARTSSIPERVRIDGPKWPQEFFQEFLDILHKYIQDNLIGLKDDSEAARKFLHSLLFSSKI